jgi:hypothetical protein
MTQANLFSLIPPKVWIYLGSLITLLTPLVVVILVIRSLFGISVSGYAFLVALILFNQGLQLLALGIIGEYAGQTHKAVKR